MNLAKRRHATPDSARSIMCPRFTPKRRCRFIGLGSASTGHWPINRRCANKLCAYGVLPILVGKTHLLSCNIVPNPQRLCIIDQFAARGQCRLGRGDRATIAASLSLTLIKHIGYTFSIDGTWFHCIEHDGVVTPGKTACDMENPWTAKIQFRSSIVSPASYELSETRDC